MRLHQVKPNKYRLVHKRYGRGESSGKGKTSSRGTKGQKSRSGFNMPRRFEGGQTSFIQRIPKSRGLSSQKKIKFQIVNFSQLEKKYSSNDQVNPKTLKLKKIIKTQFIPVKILAQGKLTKKLKFTGCFFSKSAHRIINKISE